MTSNHVDDSAGVKHLLAGVTFPDRSGSLELGDINTYDRFGQDWGAAYSGAGALAGVEVTTFVFPASSALPNPLQAAIDEITSCHTAAVATGHGTTAVSGVECSWAEFDLAGNDPGEVSIPSWLWLVEHDGWIVKNRCTSRGSASHAAVAAELHDHMSRVGLPDTSRRVKAGHQEALVRSLAALRGLEQWEPPQVAETRDLLRAVGEYRRNGRFDEAIDAVEQALAAGVPARGLHAELGRLHLLSDHLLSAGEACMAEEEIATAEERALETALRAFMPEGITFKGGWGASLDSPVLVQGSRSSDVFVSAVHRYLQFALGTRGLDWKLATASLVSLGGMVFDAMEVFGRSGQAATVVVLNPHAPADLTTWSGEPVIGTLRTGNSVRGEAPELTPDGQTAPSSQMTFTPALNESTPEVVKFVLKHLLTHMSQTLVLAGDELL